MLWLAGIMGLMAVGAGSFVALDTSDDDSDADYEELESFEDDSESIPLEELLPEPLALRGGGDLVDDQDIDELTDDFVFDPLGAPPTNPLMEAEATTVDTDVDAPELEEEEDVSLVTEEDDLDTLDLDDTLEDDPYAEDSSDADAEGIFVAGTMDDDALEGTAGDDFMDGYAGSDSLEAGDGDDILNSMRGAGANALFGGITEEDGDTSLADATRAEDVDADELDAGEGDDTIYAGGGDVIFGGAGADDIVIGDWTSESGVPVQMADFDGEEDQLLLVWDNFNEDEPEVELEQDPDDPDVINVYLDDDVVAQVPASSGLTPDQISLMPLSEASAMQWGWN